MKKVFYAAVVACCFFAQTACLLRACTLAAAALRPGSVSVVVRSASNKPALAVISGIQATLEERIKSLENRYEDACDLIYDLNRLRGPRDRLADEVAHAYACYLAGKGEVYDAKKRDKSDPVVARFERMNRKLRELAKHHDGC